MGLPLLIPDYPQIHFNVRSQKHSFHPSHLGRNKEQEQEEEELGKS
jgi:hypothetical protein